MLFDLDRRCESRTPCTSTVLINLGYGIRGRGVFIDISPSGLLLRSDELFKLINPHRYELLLSREIKIMLPALMLLGELVRVNSQDHALAARLAQISDLELWLSLCQDSIDSEQGFAQARRALDAPSGCQPNDFGPADDL